jgi:glyoxylase-like metal-dependent hydrolase (beta-lactamase superfamily II)
MNLEDHLGDIIRKARGMSGIAAGIAARAAGISEADLAALQDSGQVPASLRLAQLAETIGLNPAKLESIAKGWRPAKPDLNRWRGFRMFTSAGDDLAVNCYLVWDEQTRAAALFDTGFDSQPISSVIAAERLELRHIFITHSHPDHVAALAEMRAAFPAAALHSGSPHAPAAQRLSVGLDFSLGDLCIAHRATPGHAADGVTYVITRWPGGAPALAVVGDAIFAGSMGRGNDSWELARQKVRTEILSLPPDTLLCPGHGPLTTVAEECAHNPFF